jgi:superfamily II DNA or RNA helicase
MASREASPDAPGGPEPAARPSSAFARDQLRQADDLRQLASRVVGSEAQLRDDVEAAFKILRGQMVRREVAAIPIARLRETTPDGRLRLGPLERAGFRTVLQVLDATPAQLQAVPGVGTGTAAQAIGAARQVAAAVEDGLKVRIDLDPANEASTTLLGRLRRLGDVERRVSALREPVRQLDAELTTLLAAAAHSRSRLRMLFAGRRGRADAVAALMRVRELLDWSQRRGLTTGLGRAEESILAAPADPAAVWRDFEQRAAEYYGWLGEIVDLGLDVQAAEGFLPADVVARVHEQQLDDRFRRVSLRGYQSFGARFALVQRRVIIGDEMGLGKTIEAIAAIAHLKALGRTHFLVVCPASVLINWMRELATHSRLRSYRLHGIERAANLKAWIRRGDVAVTTFDSLHALTVPPDVAVAMLVVDEAHYVKNPAARRSRAVYLWTERAERILFLTGTPMENRVEEFKNLVYYLQPQAAALLDGSRAVAGPDAFRRAVAPVYLRRNQEDVLSELPELVRTDEWVEFGRQDFVAYRDAVAAGNFMAMRRAAYASTDPSDSAKLQRLLELVVESAENGRKVVVFSYFRDVLATVHSAISRRVFQHVLGPVTGNVPPTQRQAAVDEFSRAEGNAVLICQIQAGGVGLNMQAASVVIICEPQIKPTTEDQAIARAHRMGQVRPVQVHRLLVADSVDQRMLEILAEKIRVFDQYARRSDVAEASPEAIDISEAELARRVVEMEQERLALQAIATQYEDPPTNGVADG